MTQFFRRFGAVLVVLFAISAFGASTGVAKQFHSEGEPTSVKGSQVNTHVLKTTAGEITCAKATFEGTLAAKTASSITLNPTYSECHINFFGSKVSATINLNGCDYTIYPETNLGGQFYLDGTLDINCPAGKKIVYSAAGCTVELGAQTGRSSILTSNKESKHIDITFSLSGISYSHSGFTCGTGSGTTGTYKGTTTFEGSKGKIWSE